MAALLELAGAVPKQYRAMYLTAGLAGLRQGELLALRRGDVDLRAGVIHVRRKRQQLDSGEIIESEPKSEAGKRTVALPEPLIDELRGHMVAFVAKGSDSYVFTSADGEPIERNNFREPLGCQRPGPPVSRAAFSRSSAHGGNLGRPHGSDTKELMARLGHASSNAALIYQHASAERDRSIADGLSEMFRKAQGDSRD